MTTARILVVDDDRGMCQMIETALRASDIDVVARLSAEDGLLQLERESFDVVVSDVRMRGLDGLAFCERVVANHKDLPVVLITGFGSMDTAIAAIRAGAYDFLPKPVDMDVLILAVRRALQHRSLNAEVKRLRRVVDQTKHFDELRGSSPAMRGLFDLLERIAPSDAPVLILGESGSGKELVARALHRQGPRAPHPFVAVNCAAIPSALIESELFGHVKGAFTDARESRRGVFAEAHGGTLFLDEIGDLPLAMQPKLLRVLQDKRVRPVGGTSDRETHLDVRVICATNRDLIAGVADKTFREDLYYRINVIQVPIPPLRVRGNDILHLAQYFIDLASARVSRLVEGLTPEAAQCMLSYGWPGNVRELQNVMERAVIMARYNRIVVDDLPEHMRSKNVRMPLLNRDPMTFQTVDEVERVYILEVLAALGGNKTAAAQVLGLDRRTLYRKLERYGVDVAET
jgi:two-component system, NtrC family, response regulator AtoC